MGIATDLARIKGNITAALAAIADKGVTVPDGSTSDALAELIASIQAGGGMKVCSGTFTPAENTISYTVEHDLLKMPRIYCVMLSTNADKGIVYEVNPTYRFLIGCDFWDNGSVFLLYNANGTYADRVSYNGFNKNSYINSINENSITFGSVAVNTSYMTFKANTEYMWFVAG